jgi:hypothetical protein
MRSDRTGPDPSHPTHPIPSDPAASTRVVSRLSRDGRRAISPVSLIVSASAAETGRSRVSSSSSSSSDGRWAMDPAL